MPRRGGLIAWAPTTPRARRQHGHIPDLPRRLVRGLGLEEAAPAAAGGGHEVFTPTYTGLGERAHLAHPLIDLETHIRDILAVIEAEGLRDILLVGHSYGGMVATGVADRVQPLIRHLCYLDAFVPQDGRPCTT